MQVREPQGPIQRGFAGLLGLLGIKGQASLPNSIAGYVQPVLDVEKYILAMPPALLLKDWALTGDTSTAFYLPAPLPTPPEGRCWIVRNVSLAVTVDELSNLRCCGIARRVAPALPSSIEDITTSFRGAPWAMDTGGAPPYAGAARANCLGPLILLPGEVIGASIDGFTHNGVNGHADFAMTYIEVPL